MINVVMYPPQRSKYTMSNTGPWFIFVVSVQHVANKMMNAEINKGKRVRETYLHCMIDEVTFALKCSLLKLSLIDIYI